jgi:hypothetical protein
MSWFGSDGENDHEMNLLAWIMSWVYSIMSQACLVPLEYAA